MVANARMPSSWCALSRPRFIASRSQMPLSRYRASQGGWCGSLQLQINDLSLLREGVCVQTGSNNLDGAEQSGGDAICRLKVRLRDRLGKGERDHKSQLRKGAIM